MNTTELAEVIKNALGSNLFAIISVGSLTTEHFNDAWSDVDLLLIFERLSLRDKEAVGALKIKLENAYQKKFGINVLTKSESLNPIFPEILLDGKALQGLLDLSINPKRCLYCSDPSTKFFVPNQDIVHAYSLSNISMFLRRNRKSLISESDLFAGNIKKTTERELRASFIITKLAVQYKSGYTCSGYDEILKKAERLFSDFDFSTLKKAQQARKSWEKFPTETLKPLLAELDLYIETFSLFILDQS